jgi:hypothetical protein
MGNGIYFKIAGWVDHFEVNLITHLGVIAPFSSIFFFLLILFVLYFKNYWIQDGANGHNFERGPPKDHFSKVWLRLVQ